MVRGCLRRGVRAVWRVRRRFTKRRVFLCKRAIDFVRRNVQKTKVSILFSFEPRPVMADRLQETEGANHVSLDELLCPMNGPIHVGFRSKMDDCRWPVCLQQG